MSQNNIGPGWNGMLTVNNVERVVEALRKFLEGKWYTFVAVNMDGTETGRLIRNPEVRTGQKIHTKNPFSFYYGDDKKFAGFNVGDSYGVWGCSTNLQDDTYDPNFNNPYIVFEWRTITITHRAPAGHLIYWVIAVEGEIKE